MKKKNEYLLPLAIVMSLFFLCGLSTVLNSILIPYLQQVQKISYTSANLIQVSFYSAYLLFSPLTAYLLKSIHYVTGMKRGILFATLGSALLTFATAITSFPLILIGIFFVGGGIAMLQVTGNPYVMKLGSIETASRRMVALHAVTATGMIIAPLLGSHFILEKIEESYQHLIGPLGLTYLALTFVWILLYFLSQTLPQTGSQNKENDHFSLKSFKQLFSDPILLLGALGIITSVGIEVSSCSFMVKYIASEKIMNNSLAKAGEWTILFWSFFTFGRFAGTVLLKHLREESILLLYCSLGAALLAISITSSGTMGAIAMVISGFSSSIIFPIVFSLTLQRAKSSDSQVSAILCMANIGGAIYPMIQGVIADSYSVHLSYLVPLLGYLIINSYALTMHTFPTRTATT